MTTAAVGSATVLDGAASRGARAAVTAPARPMRILGAVAGRYALLGPEPSTGGPLVCLEAPGGIELPVSVIVDAVVLDDALDAPSAVMVGDGGVLTRRRQVVVRRWIEDRVVAGPGRGLDAAGAAQLRAGLARAPEPSEPSAVFERTEAFGEALMDGAASHVRRSAEALIGLGLGATPAGDDVVAGATVALHADGGSGSRGTACLDVLRSVIDDGVARTAPLSGALLRAAAEGRAVRALRRLIESGPETSLRELLAVGHSSGYFLAAGVLAAVQALNR